MRSYKTSATIRVFKALSMREVRTRRMAARIGESKIPLWIFIGSLVVPLIIAISFGLLYSVMNWRWAGAVSMAALIVEYLSTILCPLLELVYRRRAIFKAIKYPFNTLLRNVELTTNVDLYYLERLRNTSGSELRFIRLELEAERDALAKRIGLVTGAIDKVGLFPGVLSLIVALTRIGTSQPEWVYGIAYATPILYAMGAGFHILLLRFDRHLSLIDYTIETQHDSP